MKLVSFDYAKEILHNKIIPISIYKKYDKIYKNLYNIEHIIPQSYDKSVKSDLHILFLANHLVNSLRNNYRFVDFIKYDDAYFSYIYIENNEIIVTNHIKKNKNQKNILYYAAFNHKKKLFIPPNDSKGMISRALLYYKNIYKKNDICNKVIQEDLMYKWNTLYKVSEEEYLRNLQIRDFQNNNNPFIYY